MLQLLMLLWYLFISSNVCNWNTFNFLFTILFTYLCRRIHYKVYSQTSLEDRRQTTCYIRAVWPDFRRHKWSCRIPMATKYSNLKLSFEFLLQWVCDLFNYLHIFFKWCVLYKRAMTSCTMSDLLTNRHSAQNSICGFVYTRSVYQWHWSHKFITLLWFKPKKKLKYFKSIKNVKREIRNSSSMISPLFDTCITFFLIVWYCVSQWNYCISPKC